MNNKERIRRGYCRGYEGSKLVPAVAAVPLVTPNEAGFTIKAPKLETSEEFQGNGEWGVNLFSLSFLIPTVMLLKDLVFLELE